MSSASLFSVEFVILNLNKSKSSKAAKSCLKFAKYWKIFWLTTVVFQRNIYRWSLILINTLDDHIIQARILFYQKKVNTSFPSLKFLCLSLSLSTSNPIHTHICFFFDFFFLLPFPTTFLSPDIFVSLSFCFLSFPVFVVHHHFLWFFPSSLLFRF